jgi:cell division protein FtsN
VRLGPIKTEQKAEKLIEELKENGFDNAFQVLVQAE